MTPESRLLARDRYCLIYFEMRCPIDGEQVTKTPSLYWTANGKRKTTMRINTLVFDANLPTVQQVNIPTNTDAKIGIKVKKNGEYLNLDNTTLSVEGLVADTNKVNGYVAFPIQTADAPYFVQKTVTVNTPTTQAIFKLNVNCFSSQQGDINVDAGGPGTDIDVNSVKTKTLEVVDSTGELAAALSSDNEGNGLLVLDNIAFTGADLSATFAANQILEGLV